jgi:hypothetical protein
VAKFRESLPSPLPEKFRGCALNREFALAALSEPQREVAFASTRSVEPVIPPPRNSENLCPVPYFVEFLPVQQSASPPVTMEASPPSKETGISKKLRSFPADSESASFANSKNCRLHFKMARSLNLCTRAKAGLSRFAIGSAASEFSWESSGIREHQRRQVRKFRELLPHLQGE